MHYVHGDPNLKTCIYIYLPGNKIGSISTKCELHYVWVMQFYGMSSVFWLVFYPAIDCMVVRFPSAWRHHLLPPYLICFLGWPTHASCFCEFYRDIILFEGPRHLCGAWITCSALAFSIIFLTVEITCFGAWQPCILPTQGSIDSVLRKWKHA